MANWCYNEVSLSGNPADIEKVKALFQEIESKQSQSDRYFLPPFIKTEGGVMFNISVNQDHIIYQSRWVPNLEVLKEIADHLNVDFTSQYEELSMGIFGEATYKNKILSNTRLDGNALQSYYYDSENGYYVHEGNGYEDEWAVLSKLLEIKKVKEQGYQTTSNITREELTALYGEMTTGDYVLKFAEHKNFENSRAAFHDLGEETKSQINNFFMNAGTKTTEAFATTDKYIAYNYLILLVDEWRGQQRQGQLDPPFPSPHKSPASVDYTH